MTSAAGAVLMALVGAQLSQQAPVNRNLAQLTGAVPAAFVNFAVGGALMLACCLAFGGLGGLGEIGGRWWLALGGVMAAVFVLTALVAVRSIGASGVAAGAITGQLASSVVIDSTGALGVDLRALDAGIAVGVIAVVAGTFLVAYAREPLAAASHPPARAQLLPLVAITAAGALLGVQIPLNGLLADSTGDLGSGLINFLVGGAVLALALPLTRSARGLKRLPRAHWYHLTGGIFGAVNALAALALVGEIGAATVAAATITGQLLASLTIDRLGLFGLERRPLSARRVAGAALLLAGTILVAS